MYTPRYLKFTSSGAETHPVNNVFDYVFSGRLSNFLWISVRNITLALPEGKSFFNFRPFLVGEDPVGTRQHLLRSQCCTNVHTLNWQGWPGKSCAVCSRSTVSVYRNRDSERSI